MPNLLRGVPASLALALLTTSAAQRAPQGAAAAPDVAAPADVAAAGVAGLEVHEWGTFTSVLAADGRVLGWNPLQLSAPLPGFVHRHEYAKPSYWGTVRMETPVLYVRAARPTTLDVRVSFPAGMLTEWYPAAESGVEPATLTWRGVEVVPGLDALLATGLAGEHYYAARGVDAAHVRAGGETEKFLFYRGVGSFEQPLAARVEGEGERRVLVLENRDARALRGALVFERRGDSVALRELAELAPGGSLRVAAGELAFAADVSLAPLERTLRDHGLREDEAQAMLATWRGDWFEPGLRVLYVLPRELTDELLPLEIVPRPGALERVLVGRLELVEAAFERELLAAARAIASGGADPARAFERVGPPTRFALAVLQSRLGEEPALWAAERPLVAWLERSAGSAR